MSRTPRAKPTHWFLVTGPGVEAEQALSYLRAHVMGAEYQYFPAGNLLIRVPITQRRPIEIDNGKGEMVPMWEDNPFAWLGERYGWQALQVRARRRRA